MKSACGFTLIELLIVLFLLLIIILIVIATVNPLEQFNKASDSTNETNATRLLTAIERYQASRQGQSPRIENIANSDVCMDIIAAGFVYDLGDLKPELPGWFTGEVTKSQSELYVGFLGDRSRVCYRVKSVRSISQVSKSGCSVDSLFYLCLPK